MDASFETKDADEMTNHLMTGTKVEVVILDATERMRRFGLECMGPVGDGIIFKAGHWRPGGEYVQKLIVRNVSSSVKKFKYKLPTTRYFSLAYPEIIVLSPGMFKELDVIFRPVEYNPYDDTLYITLVEGAGSGGFHVPVRATIDKLIITTPFGLDMGYCPTQQTTSVIFQLTNAGEVDAPFRWQQAQPFVIEPSEGVIPVGQSWNIRVSIFPTDASVFVAAVTCIVGEGVHAIISDPIITTRISAIGKYTYIVLSESVVDFGEVLSGNSADSTKKEIILKNNSVVPAEYELVRHESDTDEVFEISPRAGVLPPQSQVPIIVMYSALASGCYSLDRYTFRTPGGCQTMLTCQGTSLPSIISAYKDTETGISLNGPIESPEGSPGNAINFRDIEIGKTETRIMFLKNDSKKDAAFNILCGATGIFQVAPLQGVIPALSQAFPIKFTFSPPRPINYCRRVFVLIGDNVPIFYDIMGSGYIRAKGEVKEQRPAPLRFAHIQAYRNRAVQGLGGMSPPELDQMCANGSEPRFFAQAGLQGTRAMTVTALQNPLTRTGETTRISVASAHELFIEDTDNTCREITLNKTALDFGYNTYETSSEAQTVTVTNNTNGKVSLVWELPADAGSKNLNDAKADGAEVVVKGKCAFSVDPPSCDINPGQSEKFKIIFRPKQSNRNFLAELEAFIYFKNQRTFRLVNDKTLTPPWFLTVKALGHTFATGQLLATVKITGSNVKNGKLIFPTCYEGESTYQTFMLRNTSNLPSTFKFELGFNASESLSRTESSSSQVFSLTPMLGEVAAEGFVLVSVRFFPSSSRKFTQLVRCIVNGDQGGRLLVEGNASIPFVCFPEVKIANGREPTESDARFDGIMLPPQFVPRGLQGSFFLKPTHIGLSTSRQLVLKNGSRLPLRFRLSLRAEASGIVSVTPTRGILRGNETVVLTVAFAPKQASKYVFKLKAKVYPVGGRAQRVIDARQAMGVTQPECVQILSIYLVAPGEIGAILFSPSAVELPVRLVNTSESTDIFLENVSDSDLSYELLYKEGFQGDSGGAAVVPKTQSGLRPLTSARSGLSDESNLFCQSPAGILNARSRLRVVVSYEPRKAGLFNFHLFCKLKAIDPFSGEPLMLPNEETALLRTQGGAICDPLAATISSRASFPRLIIEDVRIADDSLVSDVELLWRQFDLAPFNLDLSLPLTDAECRMNGSASTDIAGLKDYRFDFTPAVIGSPVQTVYFRMRNSGYLSAAYHIHLPNEKTLDLEQWCDEDEPSEELNKIISIIEELKSFTITPQEAILRPGESCEVTISYRFSSLKYGGVHRLPVHFKVDQGKQFQLVLNGRTLPYGYSQNTIADGPKASLSLNNRDAAPPTDILLVACVGKAGVHTLLAVPVGLSAAECLRQKIEIVNVSGTDAQYDIDLQSVDRLCADHYGAPILRIANPSGVIKARSSIFVEVYFYPLEATTYELLIVVVYKAAELDTSFGFESPKTCKQLSQSLSSIPNLGGSPTPSIQALKKDAFRWDNKPSVLSFTLCARGFDPRQSIPPRVGTDVVGGAPGGKQLIRFPKQLATCSADLLDFEVVPQNCSANRLVVLQSLSKTAEVEFSFGESCSLIADGLLNIFPSSGRILPGEQVLLDFKFMARCMPMLIADRVKVCQAHLNFSMPGKRPNLPE